MFSLSLDRGVADVAGVGLHKVRPGQVWKFLQECSSWSQALASHRISSPDGDLQKVPLRGLHEVTEGMKYLSYKGKDYSENFRLSVRYLASSLESATAWWSAPRRTWRRFSSPRRTTSMGGRTGRDTTSCSEAPGGTHSPSVTSTNSKLSGENCFAPTPFLLLVEICGHGWIRWFNRSYSCYFSFSGFNVIIF